MTSCEPTTGGIFNSNTLISIRISLSALLPSYLGDIFRSDNPIGNRIWCAIFTELPGPITGRHIYSDNFIGNRTWSAFYQATWKYNRIAHYIHLILLAVGFGLPFYWATWTDNQMAYFSQITLLSVRSILSFYWAIWPYKRTTHFIQIILLAIGFNLPIFPSYLDQ